MAAEPPPSTSSEQPAIAPDTAGYGLETQSAPESPKVQAEASMGVVAPSPKGELAGVKSKEEAHTTREAGGRTFERRDEAWVQAGYAGQNTVKLMPDSKKLRKLQSEHEELADVIALGGRVIFRVNQDWYELRAPRD
jgi:hypothetical protein